MNDLGMRLAWCAVQVSLVIAPVAALHLLASRRSAASAAWIAALGLALSVLVSLAMLSPWRHGSGATSDRVTAIDSKIGQGGTDHAVASDPTSHSGFSPISGIGPHNHGLSVSLARIQDICARLERGTTAPMSWLRRWGGMLAVGGLVGVGGSLLQLFAGLWAVRLCRMRGRPVDDPHLVALLDELRGAMGCRRLVQLREVPDLTTPAAAGWIQPVVLLPEDWRRWDDAECLAVLAHELAHILRGDYAAGLVARLAVALHFYHPLVRWLTDQLCFQQELAADAVGAHFAGGRETYLLALSRLALRQDGRSPGWPARAFLPARGALIRRIAMLQDDSRSIDRPWSRSSRWVVALGLLGLTVGVTTLRSPVRGDENDSPPAVTPTAAAALHETPLTETSPIDWLYVPEKADGVCAVRPAAAFRRFGRPGLAALMRDTVMLECFAEFMENPKLLLFPADRPRMRLEDIKWATIGVHFGVDKQKNLHFVINVAPTVRMIRPFDWLSFLRAWDFKLEEIRVGERSYFRSVLGENTGRVPVFCFFLPDDRTVVVDDEASIRELTRRGKLPVPAYLTGPDWERASRGLLAYAVNNKGGEFANRYDLGRADDAAVLSLLQGVDHWIGSVDDTDSIQLHAVATCDDGKAPEVVSKAVESLVKQGLEWLHQAKPDNSSEPYGSQVFRMARGLLTNLHVTHEANTVDVLSEGFGTLRECAAMIEPNLKAIEADIQAETARMRKDGDVKRAGHEEAGVK